MRKSRRGKWKGNERRETENELAKTEEREKANGKKSIM